MNNTITIETKDLLKYGLGEHMKGKEVMLDESVMNKSIAISYKYYDLSRKCAIKDRDGNIVGYSVW